MRQVDAGQLPIWGDRRMSLAMRYGLWRQSEEGKDVAGALAELACTQARAGRPRISINLLVEQLRQARLVSIDNSFRALLARELRDRFPELQALIEIRERKTA